MSVVRSGLFPDGAPSSTVTASLDCSRCGTGWSTTAVMPSLRASMGGLFLACPRCGRLLRNSWDFSHASVEPGETAGARVSSARLVPMELVFDPEWREDG